MTREEAIDILNDERLVVWTEPEEECYARRQNEAIDMAIEALKHECESCIWEVCNYNRVDWDTEKTTEPVHGDLISRQAAVEKILRNKDAKPLNESDYQDGIRAGLDIAYCEIRDMSSAEPVHGEWVGLDECSVCGKQAFDFIEGCVEGLEYQPNFCPHCGAKMLTKESTENLNLKADGEGVSKGGVSNGDTERHDSCSR